MNKHALNGFARFGAASALVLLLKFLKNIGSDLLEKIVLAALVVLS